MQEDGYTSARPFTQAERDRAINDGRQVSQQSFNRRKVLRSGQRYNKPGTAALRKKYDSIGGN